MTLQQWGYMPAKAQEERKMKPFDDGASVPGHCSCEENIAKLVVCILISQRFIDYSNAISW